MIPRADLDEGMATRMMEIARNESLVEYNSRNKVAEKKTRTAVIRFLLDHYDSNRSDDSDSGDDPMAGLSSKIDELSRLSGEPGPIILERLIDTRLKQTRRHNKKLDGMADLTPDELRKKLATDKVWGGGRLRVWKHIEEMMEANNTADEWYQKVYITSNSVKRHLTQCGTSANHYSIKSALTEHQADISAHHERHELGINHNRNAGKYRAEKGL